MIWIKSPMSNHVRSVSKKKNHLYSKNTCGELEIENGNKAPNIMNINIVNIEYGRTYKCQLEHLDENPSRNNYVSCWPSDRNNVNHIGHSWSQNTESMTYSVEIGDCLLTILCLLSYLSLKIRKRLIIVILRSRLDFDHNDISCIGIHFRHLTNLKVI